MKNSRQDILSFIKDNFKDYELKHKSTVTREIEPRLKYFIIDRYTVNVLPPESLTKLASIVNALWDVELFFSFGYLCIGYTDNEFGNCRNCMRLDAFVGSQISDHLDQADKDFVIPGISAGAPRVDKVMGVNYD